MYTQLFDYTIFNSLTIIILWHTYLLLYVYNIHTFSFGQELIMFISIVGIKLSSSNYKYDNAMHANIHAGRDLGSY